MDGEIPPPLRALIDLAASCSRQERERHRSGNVFAQRQRDDQERTAQASCSVESGWTSVQDGGQRAS